MKKIPNFLSNQTEEDSCQKKKKNKQTKTKILILTLA